MDTPFLATAARPSLGDCLKAARRARGLTLKDVAARTGMAMSTLSKVENHQMSLTYDKLLQLSAGLGMEIAELFHTPGAGAESASYTARRSISRAGQGQLVRTKSYSYLYQCTDLLGKRMVPIMAEIAVRTLEEFGPLMRHAGEEYFMVTEGRVAVHTEFYAPEILEAGDGIYLDSNMGHAYLNVGDGPARAICVCSGDARDLYEQLRGLAEGTSGT
ncbi:transcriptional regulator, XRE family with cupin sensor [Rhizobiales bacterium GAS191]|nr:transcriptional regulator, XRE family with cupin sensor [Rhizobiales bacterium GAS113]SED76815.1 transcriptional regulator, XRE family with cupin sensor [Rhizobiales bacterium GAS188]SEE67696.1 transcriptional regulator, XRE family with cupin sensor [Rhizobiales bacterium GAS191]